MHPRTHEYLLPALVDAHVELLHVEQKNDGAERDRVRHAQQLIHVQERDCLKGDI